MDDHHDDNCNIEDKALRVAEFDKASRETDCDKASRETESLTINENEVKVEFEFGSRLDVDRGTWTNGLDFILTSVGFAVGLGNIWRFPYLCYKNGGGAFLIPYFIWLVTCGVPLLILEVGLGQYMGQGSIGTWKICPGFTGIGVASFVIAFMLNLYYIVVLTWAIYYLYSSFSSVLPWSRCDNEWNTPRCFTGIENISNETWLNSSSSTNVSLNVSNGTSDTHQTVDAVVEFWERKVLQISGGIDEPGSVVPGLLVSLLIAWLIVYFCVFRGVKWSGKVVYFTALFPYLVLTCLLIRGVTLDGATDGLRFYIKPDLSRLSDPQVWIDGGTQIFFSYAVALGGLVSLGSYNKFNNNFFKDCLIISVVNSCTSLYGGVAVFSVLGFMAKQQNVTIADVAESGPGLVFMAYPKAVTQMPLPQLWAVLFFVMILLIGLDSEFVCAEAVLTPIFDQFPRALAGVKKRMLVTAVYCIISFLIGICMVTQGGMYVFQLFDYYSASGSVLLWVSFWEAMVIAWVFGSKEFQQATELMLGYRLPYWFTLCWKYITPVACMGMFIFMLAVFKPLTYNKTYVYPRTAQGFGMCLALMSILCIPVVFLIKFVAAPGGLVEKWRYVTKPQLKEHQLTKTRSFI